MTEEYAVLCRMARSEKSWRTGSTVPLFSRTIWSSCESLMKTGMSLANSMICWMTAVSFCAQSNHSSSCDCDGEKKKRLGLVNSCTWLLVNNYTHSCSSMYTKLSLTCSRVQWILLIANLVRICLKAVG